jgi:AmmeMemoRadiSam system protein A
MLTRELKRELLEIARNAIASSLQEERTPSRATARTRPSPELLQPSGAFVTLRINGELRGCIGYMESPHPLADVVADVAVKAACEDPRFPPVTAAELDGIDLEISVLSPMRPIHDINEITIGTHGVMIELGPNRGVLLPQVAVEYGWTVEQFLSALSRKAGLHKFGWMEPDARLSIFSAEVVDEEDARSENVT